jgi:ABC-2 type transport system ATP-binding protein
MTTGILTDKLTKTYPGSKSPALNRLSLEVKPGEVYGYLGANGAGKSTTIRLLLNFIQPTSGSATINGLDIVKDSVAAKKHVGYLSGDVALWPKTTGNEVFHYLLKLHSVADKTYLQTLIKRFEASADQPIGSLSKGNRQKIGIIQAFMHKPGVLILDEPTSGLDPLMQEAFYDTVREARDRGAAILMSSHNLTEAQTICDRVGIIKHGKLIREQAVTGEDALGAPTFRVVLAHAADMRNVKGLKLISQESPTTVIVQADGALNHALKALSQFDIAELTTQQLSLEDEFLEFYGSDES